MAKKVEASAEQIDALRAFAKKHGRYWKSKLGEMWQGGRIDEGTILRGVRNQFGPTWLLRFRLPPE